MGNRRDGVSGMRKLAFLIGIIATGSVGALLLSAGAGAGLGGRSYFRGHPFIGPLFVVRDPEMVTRRRALLDRYHQSGVVGDETYEKAVSALEKRPSTRPASGPSKPE